MTKYHDRNGAFRTSKKSQLFSKKWHQMEWFQLLIVPESLVLVLWNYLLSGFHFIGYDLVESY
jgi:hypothetical protein